MTRPTTSLNRFALPLGLLALCGCSTFGEKHYFASVDSRGEAVNFFRLTVSGYSLLSSSRYESGYFDEQAVNQYFGTISQPANGAFGVDAGAGGAGSGAGTSTPSTAAHADGTGSPAPAGGGTAPPGGGTTLVPLGGAPNAHGSLVLLLSSNSDAIAENIGALAESQDTLAAVTLLANRDKLQQVDTAQTAVDRQRVRGAALKSLGEQLIGQLDDKADQVTAERNLLAYLNSIASQFGNDVPFTNLTQAKDWLNRKRATLLEE